MSQFQLHSSEGTDGARKNPHLEQSFPPGETMTQGDPAAREVGKTREIIVIPPERLSDLTLVTYLLAKQKRGALVQTHISTDKGRIVLGVRAYHANYKSPARVAFIVLEVSGEFVGLLAPKDKALQMQVYGMWNTPPDYQRVTELLRRIIPGVIPGRSRRAVARRMDFLMGERLSVALIMARKKRQSFHSANNTAA